MSSSTPDGLKAELDAGKMKVGNTVVAVTGLPVTPSMPLSVDSSSNLQVGSPLPLFAGATNTGFSLLAIEGSSTGAAADAMHLTLAQGALASFTAAGFIRVTVTDDAGNITNGAYYMPFGTLA